VQLTQQAQKAKEANAIFPAKKEAERDRKNSDLVPFLLGGLAVFIGGSVIIGLVVKRSKRQRIKN
jgi:hypothetical protein